MNKELDQNPNNRSARIMAYIEESGVTPTSRLVFLSKNILVWCLWILSILVGSMSIAVISGAVVRAVYGFYEPVHTSMLHSVLELMPYVWLPVFMTMVLLAYINLQHTNTGYRYPFWQIVCSSLLFSMAGGVLLYFMGIGYMIDKKMGDILPMYTTQERIEAKMWQQPVDGRLLGRLVATEESRPLALFLDIEAQTWELAISELHPRAAALLQKGDTVKLLGMVEEDGSFVVCDVLPAMMEARTPAELREATDDARAQLLVWRNERQDKLRTGIRHATSTKKYCMDMPWIERSLQ